MSRYLITFMVLVACSTQAFPQEFNPNEVDAEFREINKKGMLSLGGWALTNCAVSGLSLADSKGVAKVFHQMNLGWNAVNALIAGGAFWYNTKSQGDLSAHGVLERHRQMKQVLLFNAGLDVAYIVGGFFFREKALHDLTRQDQWNGYGNAIIMNGTFLLLFDSIMFWIHEKHGENSIYPHISFSPNGVHLRLEF